MIYRVVNGKVTGIDVQEEMLNGISWWIRPELVRDVNWEALLTGSIKSAGGDEDLDPDVVLQEIADSMMPTEERGGARTGMRNLHSQIWRDLMSKPFLLDADEARKVVGGRAFKYMGHEADTDALVAKYIPQVRKHYGGRIAQFISQVLKNAIRDIIRSKKGKGQSEVSLEGYEAAHGMKSSPEVDVAEGKEDEAGWSPEEGKVPDEEVKEVVEMLPVSGWDDEEYKELLGIVTKVSQEIIRGAGEDKKKVYRAIYDGKFGGEGASSDEKIRKQFGFGYRRFKEMKDEFIKMIRDRVISSYPEYGSMGKMQEKRVEERQEKEHKTVSEFGKHTERTENVYKELQSSPELKGQFKAYLDSHPVVSGRFKKLRELWLEGKGFGIGQAGLDEVNKELGEFAYPPRESSLKAYRKDKSDQWNKRFQDFKSQQEKHAHIPYSIIT